MSAPAQGLLGPRADVVGLWSVAVVVHGGDRSTLLALASALHRRAVDVLDARLTMPSAGTRTFEATISGTPRQAATVEATLCALVDVTEVRVAFLEPLTSPADGRHRSAP